VSAKIATLAGHFVPVDARLFDNRPVLPDAGAVTR